jgi:hypothetical protein
MLDSVFVRFAIIGTRIRRCFHAPLTQSISPRVEIVVRCHSAERSQVASLSRSDPEAKKLL